MSKRYLLHPHYQKSRTSWRTPLRIRKSPVRNSSPRKQRKTRTSMTQWNKCRSFPGGLSACMSYIARNVKYPTIALENGIQGRVVVQFCVEKDGSISNTVATKSVNPYLDKEALRVVSSMPKWTPGKQKGKPVRVKYTPPRPLPIEIIFPFSYLINTLSVCTTTKFGHQTTRLNPDGSYHRSHSRLGGRYPTNRLPLP